MLDPTSIKARMKYGRPEDLGSIEATDSSMLEKIGQRVQQAAEDMGLSRAAARKLGGAVQFTGEMAPGTGDVDAVEQTKRALEEGSYIEAGINAATIIPIVGKAIKAGKKPTMELFRAADKAVQPEAFHRTAQELGRMPNPKSEEDVSLLVRNAADVEDELRPAVTKADEPVETVTETVTEAPANKYSDPKVVMQEREKDVARLNAQLESREIDEGTFKRRMEAVTKKYKILLDNAKKSDQFYASKGNEPQTFKRDPNTLYHGTSPESVEGIAEEGMVQESHGLMSGATRDTSSFSSDPLFAARHYGESDADNLLKYEMSADEAGNIRNVSKAELETTTSKSNPDYYGQDEDTAGIKLPEYAGYGHESETALFNVDKERLSTLKESDPEQYKFIQKGIKEAEKVTQDQQAIVQNVVQLAEEDVTLTPAEARELYTSIRDNLKDGLSLAKYTSDNSARGTYDWYIRGWTDLASSPVLPPEDINYTEALEEVLSVDEDLASAYADIIDEVPDMSDKDMIMALQEYDDYGRLSEYLDMEGSGVADSVAYDPEQVTAGLLKLQDSLVGEQNKEMLGKLIDGLETYETRSKWGQRGKKVDGKEGVIPATEQMAKGGLVRGRTSSQKGGIWGAKPLPYATLLPTLTPLISPI